MEELLKILQGYIIKQLGKTEEQVADLLYQKTDDGKLDKEKLSPDALKNLLALDKTKVQALKDSVDKTKIFDQAFAKAESKVKTQLEKSLSKEYGIAGELELKELIPKIIETKSTSEIDADKLTEDIIKKHPVFVAAELHAKDALSELTASHATELDTLKSGYAKEHTIQDVQKVALGHFTAMNPILSDIVERATNQQADFMAKYGDYDYEKIEGSDNEFVIIQDGKRLEDEQGNLLTIKEFTESLAKRSFDFKVQAQKDAAGNTTEGNLAPGFVVPKNAEEFADAVFNANSSEERAAIEDAYEASK